MSKNNIDYELMMNVIKNELTETMERDANYFGDYHIKIAREQFFIQDNDKGQKNIFITVKFSEADVNFGQSILPISMIVIAEQDNLQVCQDLMYRFAEIFNLKRVDDGRILQLYRAPQILTNFYEIFSGFHNVLSLSGTFIISPNANNYTLSLYDETKLAIHKTKMIGGVGYTPIDSESTFLTKISGLNLLSNINRKPIPLTFNYNPLDGNTLKNTDINTIFNYQILKIKRYDTYEEVDGAEYDEPDVSLTVNVSQIDKTNNTFTNSILEYNDLIYTVSGINQDFAAGYYLIRYGISAKTNYANKGLQVDSDTISGQVLYHLTWSENIATWEIVSDYQNTDQIKALIVPTFTNSWEMVYNNTTTIISDITEYGFNILPVEAIAPSQIIISVYYKLAELEKYDYNVPFITSVFSGNFQLDTQAFYDSNNYTESVTQVGTRTLSVTTFLLDDVEFSNKLIDMICEELSVNTTYYMSVNYKNGKTYYGKFKAANFTQQQNISEIPVYNMTLTN